MKEKAPKVVIETEEVSLGTNRDVLRETLSLLGIPLSPIQ